MSNKKVVALYTRISTVEQAEEGYSIEEQERLLKEYWLYQLSLIHLLTFYLYDLSSMI